MADIKAKMGVDGAGNFRSAMRDAKNSVKELDSELKLAESQFKVTGDSQELMKTKSDALKREIEAQEKVVSLLSDELNKAKGKYGENSAEVTKLKTELNKAKTQQNNMKQALNQTQEPLGQVSETTGELGTNAGTAAENTGTLKDNLQSIASNISLETVANFASGLSGAIEAAAQKAKELGVAVWNLGGSAGQTADEWLTMSQQTGLSVEQLQKYAYAGRFVDTTLENITGSLTKFKQGVKDNKSLKEVQKLIGATNKEMKGMSETDMYWKSIDAIGEMYRSGNIDKAEDAAMKFFGRSAANLNPLFAAGREAFESLGEEAENLGYILSEEQVQNLGSYDDQMQQLEASVQALELTLADSLLPVLKPVADGLQSVSDALLAFLQSEEGQKAMQDMSKALGDMVTSIAQDIPSAITGATEFVTNFAQAFSDAETAVQTLKAAIITLGSVWAASKLVTFGAEMVKAGAALKQLFPSIFGGGGGTPTTPTTPTVTPPVTPTTPATGAAAGAAGKSVWGSIGNFLTKPGTKVAGGFLAGTYTFLEPLINQINEANKRQSEINADSENTEIIEAARKYGDNLKEAQETIDNYMVELGLSYEEAKEAYTEGKGWEELAPTFEHEAPTAEEQANAQQRAYYESLEHSTDDYADALKRLDAALVSVGEGEGDFWLKESVEELKNLDVGHIFSDDVVEGLNDYDSISAEDFSGWTQNLRDQLAVAAGEAGSAVPSSLADGMEETEMEPWEEMELIDDEIEDTAQAMTPQMVIAGADAILGLTGGLLKSKKKAVDAAHEVADAVVQETKKTMDEHSPSKVMATLGRFAAEGFGLGIEDGVPSVTSAVDRMLGAVTGAPIYGGAAAQQAGLSRDNIISALNGAQVVMDGQRVGELIFPYIDSAMGYAQQRRYA